jgi:fatty acid desaturase
MKAGHVGLQSRHGASEMRVRGDLEVDHSGAGARLLRDAGAPPGSVRGSSSAPTLDVPQGSIRGEGARDQLMTRRAQIRCLDEPGRIAPPEGGYVVPLSAEQSHSLRAELDALRQEYAAQVGARDAEYIRTVRAVARASRVTGRLLIHFSLEPVSWTAGVLALGTYKVLENMEIGHNVLHGQYDFMRDPELSSATYEWDMAGTAKSWKRAHNATHHVFTNVIGRDRDFGYNAFRFSDDVPWKPIHLVQPLLSPLTGLFFEYSIGAYDLGLFDALGPRSSGAPGAKRRGRREIAGELWAFARKAARKGFVEYVFYPALAGPLAVKVLAGNLAASALRNGWAYAVIYCGHLTERTASFREEDLAGEDRAGWYARQVKGSSNFEIGRLGRVLSGHLGYQIEHHLFPNIPAWRYPAMAPRVREICERHGLPYTTGSLRSQFASAMRRLVRFAVPRRRARPRAAPRP